MTTDGRININALPDDPETLKRMVRQLFDRVDHLEVDKLRLEMELLQYRKRYYGPRADRLASHDDVNQMLLAFARDLEARPIAKDDEDEVADLPAETPRGVRGKSGKRGKKSGRRRLADLDHLPVRRCEHDLPDEEKCCPGCGAMRERIGKETTWQIEYIPGHFERIEHVQFKYGCGACDQKAKGAQIDLARKPLQPIEKGLPAPGLLAYVVTSKFSDYLPLYRLESIFARCGVEIARGTMSLWCRDVADLVRPLYELMIERVLESHVIATDDTTMPMLVKGKGKAQRARVWVYIGDESHPYNIFDFTLGRSRDGPTKFLNGYNEVLLADAYGGYDGVVVREGITRAGCWAHARRKFVENEAAKPEIAAEAVELIGRLYRIEDEARDDVDVDVDDDAARNADAAARARLKIRQEKSLPVLEHLKDRLDAWRDQLLPKHPMAQAVRYALNQWETLTVFARDAAVPIDNNMSEREMKRIVLNRKNSLFVNGPRGGRTSAILASLTSTCRRHAIDPQHYLTKLLTNLPATKMSDLHHWLPDAWKTRQTTSTGAGAGAGAVAASASPPSPPSIPPRG